MQNICEEKRRQKENHTGILGTRSKFYDEGTEPRDWGCLPYHKKRKTKINF